MSRKRTLCSMCKDKIVDHNRCRFRACKAQFVKITKGWYY